MTYIWIKSGIRFISVSKRQNYHALRSNFPFRGVENALSLQLPTEIFEKQSHQLIDLNKQIQVTIVDKNRIQTQSTHSRYTDTHTTFCCFIVRRVTMRVCKSRMRRFNPASIFVSQRCSYSMFFLHKSLHIPTGNNLNK